MSLCLKMSWKACLWNINIVLTRLCALCNKVDKGQCIAVELRSTRDIEILFKWIVMVPVAGTITINLKCIWQIFFICSIKSPQCADKCSKKIFSIAIFLLRVLMCQKRQISLPVGYKTATTKTRDWERLWRQFRTPSLAKNRFLSHFLIAT